MQIHWRTVWFVTLALALAVACAPRVATTQDANWVLLGQREVSDRTDHDVIPVTAARGEFRRIKFVVLRAPVQFHQVVVRYGNGSFESLDLRETIPAGDESRAVNLAGGDRVIRSIEFWYDANTMGRRALVRAFGLR